MEDAEVAAARWPKMHIPVPKQGREVSQKLDLEREINEIANV